MGLTVIDSGSLSASKNMDIDREILQTFTADSAPILRFYEFRGPSATYGHFVKPENLFDMAAVAKWGLDLAKRPTGGGVIFHLTDFTFSFFIPSRHPWYSENTLASYRNINEAVVRALGLDLDLLPNAEPGPRGKCFCMAHPSKYDIIYQGKKVGGAAQRRVVGGFLHQASLLLTDPPYDRIEEVLLGGKEMVNSMRASSYPLSADQTFRESFKEKLLSESNSVCYT